jgi:hypothetical protein
VVDGVSRLWLGFYMGWDGMGRGYCHFPMGGSLEAWISRSLQEDQIQFYNPLTAITTLE